MGNAVTAKITLVFFNAGGGHRAAAQALVSVIQARQRPWKIELLNLQELLDEIDPARKVFKIRVQEIYNGILSCGWTLGAHSRKHPRGGVRDGGEHTGSVLRRANGQEEIERGRRRTPS